MEFKYIERKEDIMEIEALRQEKEKLESEILNAVCPLFERFKKETGYSPNNIYLDIMPALKISSNYGNYIITKCKVQIYTGL